MNISVYAKAVNSLRNKKSVFSNILEVNIAAFKILDIITFFRL